MRFLRAGGLLAVAVMIMLAGCSAAPNGTRPSGGPSTPAPTTSASIPADGVSLAELGFQNGPSDRVSLPRDVSFVTSADQPAAVTLVIDSPSGEAVATYLRRTLPAAGFTVDSDLGTTLAFSGYGWTGNFTGSPGGSALVLRPSAVPPR
ncbi:hypothetical protein [Microlunatus sp. GCM10028923]|uniref:hypothetical protein n=1 Tax=Microlunatus sp. GCM10028923 TaxID=3273400 RepID=UPI0036085BE1